MLGKALTGISGLDEYCKAHGEEKPQLLRALTGEELLELIVVGYEVILNIVTDHVTSAPNPSHDA